MKFSVVSIVTSAAFISQALATPAPQGGTVIYHCGGPYGLKCPAGYTCCGPLIVGVGGTCIQGIVFCPLEA